MIRRRTETVRGFRAKTMHLHCAQADARAMTTTRLPAEGVTETDAQNGKVTAGVAAEVAETTPLTESLKASKTKVRIGDQKTSIPPRAKETPLPEAGASAQEVKNHRDSILISGINCGQKGHRTSGPKQRTLKTNQKRKSGSKQGTLKTKFLKKNLPDRKEQKPVLRKEKTSHLVSKIRNSRENCHL